MISFEKIRPLARALLLLFLLAFSIIIFVHTLIHSRPVQKYLMEKISQHTGIDIRTGDMALHFYGGTGLIIKNFHTQSRNGEADIRAPEVDLVLDTRKLLAGRFVVASVHITRPEITIKSEMLSSESEIPEFGNNRIFSGSEVQKIIIKEGSILLSSRRGDFIISSLDLDLRKKGASPFTMSIISAGDVEHRDEKTSFDLTGDIIIPGDRKGFPCLNVLIKTGKFPTTWIYWSKFIRMAQGNVSAEVKISGEYPDEVSLDGMAFFDSVKFDYIRKGRIKKYSIPELVWEFDSVIMGREINVHPSLVKTPDVELELDFIIDLEELKNPFIDMTVKSGFMPFDTFRNHFPLPVTNRWLEDMLFPVLEKGDIRMDLLGMKGTVDQFRNIRKEENRSIFTMDLDCRNFTVSGEGIQLPFSGVSAIVKIFEHNFHIYDLKGRFGKDSVIEHGGLTVHGMLSGDPFTEIMVKGAFDLEELISQRDIYVIPPRGRESLNNYENIRGKLTCDTTIGYRKGWEIPRIIEGLFLFRDLEYHKRMFSLPVRFTDLEFRILEKAENRFSGNGIWGRSPFYTSGVFEIEGEEIGFKSAEIETLMDMNQAVSVLFKNEKFPFRFRKPVPWRSIIVKREDSYSINGAIDISALDMESGDFVIHPSGAGGSVEYSLDIMPDDRITLNRANFDLGGTGFSLAGDYDLKNKHIEDLHLMSSGLSLEDLGLSFTGTDSFIKGDIQGDVLASLSSKNREDLNINGYIEGSGIFLQWHGLPLLISDCGINMEFVGKELIIRSCSMSADKNSLSVTGRIEGWKGMKGDLALKSDFFDLTDIILKEASKENKDSFMDRGMLRNIDMTLNADIKEGVWRKLKYNNLSADLRFMNGTLKIDNARANLEHGILDASGSVATGRNRRIDISGNISLKDQSIEKLFDEISIGDRGIKGTLLLDAGYEIKIEGDQRPLEGLSGEIRNFEINQGLIKNSRVFVKVLDFLNIPDKFKKRPPELREEGFYFELMSGNASIENGLLRTDNYVLKSPVFNAAGAGNENLVLREHDFRFLVQPMGNIDSIISYLPIIGNILVCDDETIFSVGYNVSGPWDNPQIEMAPVENLKGLFGVFKRAVLIPVNLFNGIKNAAKNGREKEIENTEE